jgi:ribosomal-protein-alanine N-acetyltransferase
MTTIEPFATARLVAEPLGIQHFEDLARMHQDPRVMKTLAPAGHPNGGMLTETETRRMIERDVAHWQRYGYGLWALRDITSAQFVGRSGLHVVRLDEHDEVELAYALVAEAWGQGLATEIAAAVLGIGFEQLGLSTIVCFTLTTNLASQRVMQKAGFTYERDFIHAGLPHVLYRMTADEWQETKNRVPMRVPFGHGRPRTKNIG